MNISGYTKLLAVVGKPVSHSLSPKLHNFLAEKLNLDYIYLAFEPENISDTFNAVKTLDIKGLNVTAPYKYDAFKNVDIVSETARLCESVNTVVNNNGVLTGYSTDGEGLYLAMKTSGIDIENKNILVLGAGGASKPICVMLKQKGAASVTIKNRTASKAYELSELLNSSMNTEMFWVYEKPGQFDIVINTTSVGMGSTDTPVDDETVFDFAEAAVDIIYHPKKTTFLKTAEKRGIKTINGIGMLAFQGIIAFELFTGVTVPENLYMEAIRLINE